MCSVLPLQEACFALEVPLKAGPMAAAGSASGTACKDCPWLEVDRASAVAAGAAVVAAADAADGDVVVAGLVEALDSHTAGMDCCSYLRRLSDARSCTRCPVW